MIVVSQRGLSNKMQSWLKDADLSGYRRYVQTPYWGEEEITFEAEDVRAYIAILESYTQVPEAEFDLKLALQRLNAMLQSREWSANTIILAFEFCTTQKLVNKYRDKKIDRETMVTQIKKLHAYPINWLQIISDFFEEESKQAKYQCD